MFMQHLIDLKLPLYDGGDMVLCRDVGHGAKMALIADTCEANYLDYVNTLRDACFTLTARNEIAGNRFTALQRDNIAVTLYYTAYARCVRVIVEPKESEMEKNKPNGERHDGSNSYLDSLPF